MPENFCKSNGIYWRECEGTKKNKIISLQIVIYLCISRLHHVYSLLKGDFRRLAYWYFLLFPYFVLALFLISIQFVRIQHKLD